MRIQFIENIKKMIESLNKKKEFPESPADLFNMVDPRKIKKHYEKILADMEVHPIDMNDHNVQMIYAQACNFLALQSFKFTVGYICEQDPLKIETMTNDVLQAFFRSVKGILFRKLEVNELINDTNNKMKSIIGSELIEEINKCNSEKITQAINLAEDLIRKSLNMEDNENI